MPKPHVYVETTIPSFYHDPRTSPAVLARRRWTRLWWASAAERYSLVTSEYVLNELANGTKQAARLRVDLLDEVPWIEADAAVERIAQIYIQQKLMPANPPHDAWHLALASKHRCDLIVTWNCKHLANPNKTAHLERINRWLGLDVPRLVTPRDLLRRGR
jgi:predicted nucleic acid-binding protein